VVDAFRRHLPDVAAELSGQHSRPLGTQPVIRPHTLPLDVLENEHLLCHVRLDHLGDDEVRLVGDQSRDQRRVVGLLREVELGVEVLVDFFCERRELKEPRRSRTPLGKVRSRAQEIEVDVCLLEDTRPSNLGYDLSAVDEECLVDLRDGRSREGLRVDSSEDALAQLTANHRLEVGERHGRHLVDEPGELLDVDVRHQIRPGREELAELHVGRPELLQRLAEL